ncbi:MAG: hypothetical protein O3A66_01220 [Proteobacteria bacterium]|jgi:hypothetical protein|nr:hypothetical protein [Pseudomonadota bacterium]
MAKKSIIKLAILFGWLANFCGTLTACNLNTPVFYPKVPEEGSPLYRMAFKDGCDTGLTVYGNDVVRMKNQAQIKTEYMNIKTYKNAWKLGYTYCKFHLNQMQGEGWAVKDFPRPVYGNRMKPHDENLFRERVTDSFWWNVDYQNPYAKDSTFFQMENGDESFGGMGAGIMNMTSPKHNMWGVKGIL